LEKQLRETPGGVEAPLALKVPFGCGKVAMMKPPHALWVCFQSGLLLAMLLLLNPGCASKPKVDWNQRVGTTYTYDDAVRELGPPAASTQLQDGTTVAEWFLKYGAQMSFGFGSSMYGGAGGVGVGQSISTPPTAHFLRLVFGSDGRLQHWEKFKR
jgi:hypothetical protein